MTNDRTLIRPLITADQPWASAMVAEYFASDRVVSRGVLHETGTLPGLVAHRGAARVGLLLYQLVAQQLEVVVIIAKPPRSGVGRQLIRAVERVGREQRCQRAWLVTTNDNTPAIGFYRAAGWHRCAVHPGAVAESRVLKPEIPLTTSDGVPIRDEVEFELVLG